MVAVFVTVPEITLYKQLHLGYNKLMLGLI